MINNHLIFTAAVSALVSSSWALSAQAQQQPGANVPTPVPAESSDTPVATTVTLREPVIDTTTHRSSLPNTPLLVTGLVVLGASYGASAAYAGVTDRESDNKLYYPVVGPWMAWNDRDCDASPCKNETLGTALLIGSGVVQGVGALSMVMSVFIPRKTTHEWYLIGNSDVQVTPLAGPGALGALASGRF